MNAQEKYSKSEKGKATQARYNKSDKCKVVQAKHRKTEKHKSCVQKYRKTERSKASIQNYRKSEKAKVSINRYLTKRRRDLGFHPLSLPLSVPFDWHHVNKNDVVAIQRYIHRAVSHICGDGKLEGVVG